MENTKNTQTHELHTTYTADLELLGRELDQQLARQPPLDEIIKAIVLLRHSTNAAGFEKSGNTTIPGGGQHVENLGPPRSVPATGGRSATREKSLSRGHGRNGAIEFGRGIGEPRCRQNHGTGNGAIICSMAGGSRTGRGGVRKQ